MLSCCMDITGGEPAIDVCDLDDCFACTRVCCLCIVSDSGDWLLDLDGGADWWFLADAMNLLLFSEILI